MHRNEAYKYYPLGDKNRPLDTDIECRSVHYVTVIFTALRLLGAGNRRQKASDGGPRRSFVRRAGHDKRAVNKRVVNGRFVRRGTTHARDGRRPTSPVVLYFFIPRPFF